ncbi:polysaccharide deacetylase family protein [Dyella japonica]|uniref:Peptidoglycan/xylan/chitin deacetylase (PgdA/CDA1 family) n=1 Tax=Dyella japonica TaxID=231455 RepID=A0ABV2JRX7_9GAMM
MLPGKRASSGAVFRGGRSVWNGRLVTIWLVASLIFFSMWTPSARADDPVAAETCRGKEEIVILLYHRFSTGATGETTVRFENLLAQLAYLRHRGYEFRSLREVVGWRKGLVVELPCKTAVFTVDDGHRSTFDILQPVIKANQIPVTLFIYPSAISNASYAMTWDQLSILRDTGLFDIQSHTVWHPNFKTERRRLTPAAYRVFVADQLSQSRMLIENRVGGQVDFIAWPFGIHDEALESIASREGYVAGFALGNRRLSKRDPLLAMPRITMPDVGDAAALDHFFHPLESAAATDGQ